MHAICIRMQENIFDFHRTRAAISGAIRNEYISSDKTDRFQ